MTLPVLPTKRPATLALGNHLDIVIDDARVRGVKSDVLAFRGFIGSSRLATTPIHATLEAPADAQGSGSGDYIAPISGASITEHLTAYLHRRVWIIAESVPPGAYRDAFPVTVVEDQSA